MFPERTPSAIGQKLLTQSMVASSVITNTIQWNMWPYFR